ncbi:hypothetical protein FH972_004423 [Carpinus fangiana]|uniref:Sieve element occlusion N-terminal domain-containing protein n=1 Tax=Carpinus fangiana TaxID=176857 RepID=A0A5N6QL29_9ROSI|nr:hypothetical protein FH972_004423 [Carpinus fangiana]
MMRPLPVIGLQPSEGELNVLTMSNEQIVSLISATHDPADDNFDAHSVFVVVKNVLKRATRIVDNLLLGQEHLENLEEKVSRASFDPLLCILKQLSSEMVCTAKQGVEIAHETTMSILNKLSSSSWDAKAVLTLAAFALNYEDFLALENLHSPHKLVESMEIPKHVPATLKHLDLQKYGKTIGEVGKMINNTLDVMDCIFELKRLSTNNDIKDEPAAFLYVVAQIIEGVYWIITTVAACTTQIRCLTSNEENTQDLLPLANKIRATFSNLKSWIEMCQFRIEEMKERRKLKELLQTPEEIMEALKGLIFAKNDVQPLIDGSTNKMVSIDVLEKKNLLLIISGLNIHKNLLNIHNNLLSELMLIYDGIKEKGDQYKIVWIPIVEQWTDDLREKFEMLRSMMPWYIVQYSSPVAGIKFIKEEWHFNNEPIVVVMNPQGDVENEDALHLILQRGMRAFPFTRRVPKLGMLFMSPHGGFMDDENVLDLTAFPFIRRVKFHLVAAMRPPGPYAIEKYEFLCGGKDNRWIEQFSEKVNVVAEDPFIKQAYISIELSCIGKGYKQQPFWKRTKTPKKTESNLGNQEIQKLLLSFKNESRWAVLTKWSTRVVSDHGMTIMKVLDAFEEWRVNVPKRGFEICFKEYHDKFVQIGPQPSTSWNV